MIFPRLLPIIRMSSDVRGHSTKDVFEERCQQMLENNNMASQSQRFCLRWNNHQSNLLSVFDQLLQEQCFVDVTLAVEGRFLRAHKMVLSACSPYFQTLFTEHPDKHPIVILKDVPYSDMRCLLDFMYRGEVSVNQDRLTAFLKVAETLRIKGLTEVKDDRGGELPVVPTSVLPPPQLHRINPRPFGYPPLMAAPLLGSALTAPKRKRGRPRKLSGSSEVEVESDGERGSDSLNLPELLEIKMDDGRDERCSNGDGELDGDVDMDDDDLPPDTSSSSGPPHGSANPFPLGELLKQPKMERRSSDESSMTYDYTPVKQEYKSEQDRSSPFSSGGTINTSSEGASKSVVKRRVRRRANSNSQDPAEHLTEMSVRGLNLFRYASIHDGLYKCTECEKVDVNKTFKNKYSFQRHAFLYHEGHQRKVFPCPVCQKEFSRPDKMKNHMKTVHECFPLKDVFPPSPAGPVGYYLPQTMQSMQQQHQQQSGKLTQIGSPKNAPSPQPIGQMSGQSPQPTDPPTVKQEPQDDEDTTSMSPTPQTPTDDPIKTEHVPTGFHFLTEEGYSERDSINEIIDNLPKTRSDLLEYLVQTDGSVVCKWCGEVLPSRTHWYRHKYKLHVPAAGLPAGLSKCLKCNTFFKSRKGYIGHCVARHGSVEEAEREEEEEVVTKTEVEEDEDVENVSVNTDVAKPTKASSEYGGRRKRSLKDEMKEDYIRQREREEKLVADIIAKVKRECEAQSITMCRRGYSRRSTVMTSFKEYDKRKVP